MMLLGWAKLKDHDKSLIRLLFPGFMLFAGLLIWAWPETRALAAPSNRRMQRIIEQEISQLATGKVDPKLYMVTVKIDQNNDKKSNKLPFSPFDVDTNLLNGSSADGADNASFEEIKFSITLNFDPVVAQSTVTLLQEAYTARFAIDGKDRILQIKRRKIYDPSNEAVPATAVETARIAAEKQRLEIERSEAKLEAEKSKLEVARKDLELQKAKDKETERSADANKSRGLKLAETFQLAFVGIIAAIGALMCFILFGNAIRSGFTSMADGIRSAGTGIGNAMMTQHEAGSIDKTGFSGLAAVGTEAKSSAPIVDEPAWTTGTPEFEAYIALVQEKIEVLSRQRNLNFTSHFIDLVEDDATLPMAASILLALPKDATELLVKDINNGHIRKLNSFLAGEGGLATAKALRRQSLQRFYGRIAMGEFTGSPLAQLQQVGWLTRISSEDMAAFAAKLTDDHRAAFLACLSPERTKRMISAARTREIRHAIITMLPRLSEVKMDQIQRFLEFGNNSLDVAKLVRESSGVLDYVRHLSEIIGDLDPDDQELIAKSMENNPELQERLRRTYLPFRAITRVPREWLSQLVEKRSNEQVATLLYSAPQVVREHVVSALPPIRAEAINHDLKNLDTSQTSPVRRRRDSQQLQKEMSRHILALVNNGTIELAAFDTPSEAPPQPQQAPIKSAGAA